MMKKRLSAIETMTVVVRTRSGDITRQTASNGLEKNSAFVLLHALGKGGFWLISYNHTQIMKLISQL